MVLTQHSEHTLQLVYISKTVPQLFRQSLIICNTCDIMFGVIQGMCLSKFFSQLEDGSLDNNLTAMSHVQIPLRECETAKAWNVHTLKLKRTTQYFNTAV